MPGDGAVNGHLEYSDPPRSETPYPSPVSARTPPTIRPRPPQTFDLTHPPLKHAILTGALDPPPPQSMMHVVCMAFVVWVWERLEEGL